MRRIDFHKSQDELREIGRRERSLREDFRSSAPHKWTRLDKFCAAGIVAILAGIGVAARFGPEIKEELRTFANNPISQVFSITFPSK